MVVKYGLLFFLQAGREFSSSLFTLCMYELFKLGMLFLCKSLLQIWSIGRMRDAELADPNTHNNKLAT